MKGYLLIIACLLALALIGVEGKSMVKQKEKSSDREKEIEGDSEEKEVADPSESGSGSGKYLLCYNSRVYFAPRHICACWLIANV